MICTTLRMARGLVLLAALPCASTWAAESAGAYPSKPVRIVVPFVAGGGGDVLVRFIGQKLTEKWGQPVVVDNRPGGNTIIGTQAVAGAAPDGGVHIRG